MGVSIKDVAKKAGVSIDFKSRFSDGLNSRAYRVLTELPMAVYRLGDYFTSSCLLTSMRQVGRKLRIIYKK